MLSWELICVTYVFYTYAFSLRDVTKKGLFFFSPRESNDMVFIVIQVVQKNAN